MRRYNFAVEGTAADEQTYTCQGQLESVEFMDTFPLVMRLAFNQLTQGKAEYGKPGVGCRGPYSITKVVIEAVP